MESLGSLPPAFKMQILSFLDPKTLEKTLSTSSKQNYEKMPKVNFYEYIKNEDESESESKSKSYFFFTKQDLHLLDTEGYVVKDHFLGDATDVAQVKQEAERLKEEGILKPAGMSQGQNRWNNSKIRGDLHTWLNDRSKLLVLWKCPQLSKLLDKMQSLQQELNSRCQFESSRTQVQLACYPGEGSRYVRHLDAFVGGSTRRITVLYYMNESWKKEDGGELRLYKQKPSDNNETTQKKKAEKEEEEAYVDVEPLADRVIIFQSRVIEHEVLPSHAMRFALTMWFY